MAAEQPSAWSVLRDLVAPPRTRRNKDVARAMDACGLEDVAGRMPGQLSHGRRKLVGVARALARSRTEASGRRSPVSPTTPPRSKYSRVEPQSSSTTVSPSIRPARPSSNATSFI